LSYSGFGGSDKNLAEQTPPENNIMDKKIAGLLGAAAAITTVTGAQAAPAQPLTAPASYRELLEPIPNAAAVLKADDAAREQMTPDAKLERVQWHHHHHHHHGYYNPGAAIVGGVIGGIIAAQQPRPACYWTVGQPVWNGYRWVRPRVQVCP
jgi:hypothetical protein